MALLMQSSARSMNYIGDWNSFVVEKKARAQPRAVGGAEICILNGLGFITVGLSSGVSNMCDK